MRISSVGDGAVDDGFRCPRAAWGPYSFEEQAMGIRGQHAFRIVGMVILWQLGVGGRILRVWLRHDCKWR